jgi:hypothetical protein
MARLLLTPGGSPYPFFEEELMSIESTMRGTWEKVLEYASSPLHGTLSRAMRKGLRIQVNGDMVFDGAQIFIGDSFVRLTSTTAAGESVNAYYDLDKIVSIVTFSPQPQ